MSNSSVFKVGHSCLDPWFTTHVLRLERAVQCVSCRITKTTLQFVLLADWRFFKTLINNDALCAASQTLCKIGHICVYEGFDEENISY